MRTCDVDGCDRAHLARGLCSTHYNQQHQPNRHRKVETPCAQCGRPCEKAPTTKFANRFCTLECRDEWRREHPKPPPSRPLVGPVARRWCDLPARHPASTRIPPPRVWVAGTCHQCSKSFLDRQPEARYCSPHCQTRAAKDRRRAKNGERISLTTRRLVYARDAGVCQICMTEVDMALGPSHPFGPTLDHIECVSWVLVPDHTERNLRLAHRMCNSMRADRAA